MPKPEPCRNRIEMLQGTLDLVILQTLRSGPRHGYGIVQSIRTRSGEVLQVDTGSLYPARRATQVDAMPCLRHEQAHR